MKLELKHLSPYLPYGLKCEISGALSSVEIKEATGVKLNHLSYINKHVYQIYFGVYGYEFKDIKPILRPLSDLMINVDFNELEILELQTKGIWSKFTITQWEIIYSNHFDILELIEKGLAIDINTL